MARQDPRLKRPRRNDTAPLSDDLLLERVRVALVPLMDDATRGGDVARALLENPAFAPNGVRDLLTQLMRNRDPEMQANHLTEMRVAAALASVHGRHIEIERKANNRNDRRVDFGVDDTDEVTTLVEVKNLNPPLIKIVHDPLSDELRHGLADTVSDTDLHVSFLFFRRPSAAQLPHLVDDLREQWKRTSERALFLVPEDRPRLAALVVPARPDTGGRVVVYDHGQHMQLAPGPRVSITHHEQSSQRRPRELFEELFTKDNILRRLQDAEQKFPLRHDDSPEVETRRPAHVVLFCPGDWAPRINLDRYIDQAVTWYLYGQAAPEDPHGNYYSKWAAHWSFAPLHNIDAIFAVRPDGADTEPVVWAGDRSLKVRTVYSRHRDLLERVFGAGSRTPPTTEDPA